MGEKGIAENAEVISADIVDLEVLPLESDEALITKEAEKAVAEEEQTVEVEESEEQVDEPEEEIEEVEEEPETKEEKPAEVEEEKPVEDKAKQIEIDTEVRTIQKELQSAHNTVKRIAESLPEAPERPKDSEDEEAMAQYRVDMAVYKSQLAQLKMQQESSKKDVAQLCSKQEMIFRNKHKDKDISGFEKWIGEDVALQTLFYTGSKTLDTLYKWYNMEHEVPAKEKKELQQIKKKGIKFEPVSTKSVAKGNETGGNGFPQKYKYANLPMFKDFVKNYKGKASDLTGEKYTPQFIDDLCKQEYKLVKKGSLF